MARALEASEKIRLFALLRDFRRHVETVLFGDQLEAVAALDSRQVSRIIWSRSRRAVQPNSRCASDASAQ